MEMTSRLTAPFAAARAILALAPSGVVCALALACSPASDPGPATSGGVDTSTPSNGSSGTSSSCPSDLPSTCPTHVPSYAADVAPLIARTCFPCHSTGGVAAAKHDFTAYP